MFYLIINNYYVRSTSELTRFCPPIFLSHSSPFTQREDVANSDQHPPATQGNATAVTPQISKTLATITPALEPKGPLTFSNCSSFMIHCWCFLLRISVASPTAQSTQVCSRCVEKYLWLLARWTISPTSSSFHQLDLTATKCPSFKVHYWTRKTNSKKPQQEPWRFFKGSVLAAPTVPTPGGARAPKQHSLLAARCLPSHFSLWH